MTWLLSLQPAAEPADPAFVGLVIAVCVLILLSVLTTGGLVIQVRNARQHAAQLREEQEQRLARLKATLFNRQN